jgi:molybdopterin-containing oxidoreductase family iron-sulfur binding subunit
VVEAPVWVWPAHAEAAITLPLGYGRWAAGRVGTGVGFNAYRLRVRQGPHAVKVEKTGRRIEFATTQNHQRMEGREIVRIATFDVFRSNPHFANDEPRKRTPETSIYPEWQYKDYKWGMAIDLNACIGCRACTIACQAENNIPVVGKEEVARGREMHWIRVDRYDVGQASDSRSAFQPVPCMHCETAPCEEVCPVGAAVHDSEGLNVQVYNRCVGTRFCSNNCPYKVRRFNFLQYANTAIDRPPPAFNPEVTVRRRGVMEKCTYCLQRITRGRIEAEKLGRRLRDGEVVTACQAVCPTEAITFGDLNDPASRVNGAKASPLDYALLAELNTRPRTTYAALIVNPDDELGQA